MTEVAEVATTSILTSRTYITPPTTRLRGEACCYALAGVLPGVGLLIRGTRAVAFVGPSTGNFSAEIPLGVDRSASVPGLRCGLAEGRGGCWTGIDAWMYETT